jgi:dipeptidyl aminopeptidase/acylaminoacyl peptidase
VADRSGDDPTGGRSVWLFESDQRPPTRVTFAGIDEWHPVWSPDAQRLAFMSYRDGPGDIYVKSLVTAAPEVPFMADKEQKVPSDWSADSRFLAYYTDRTDSRAFQVSDNGGMEPKWRDRELFYSDRDRMLIAVPVTTDGAIPSFGHRAPLFKLPTRNIAALGFQISPDRQRVLVRMVTSTAPQPMMVVLNWMARMKQ